MEQIEKDKIILDWITKAKECYVNGYFCPGVCKAFKTALIRYPNLETNLISILQEIGHPLHKLDNQIIYRNEWIFALIPEFNFDFLDGNRNTKAYESYVKGDIPLRDIYWWERYDIESRIKAFDKLIKIYEAKVKG